MPTKLQLMEGWLSEKELATAIDRNPRTIYRWRKLGIGPPFSMMGDSPIYNTENAKHWLAAGGTAGVTKQSRQATRAQSRPAQQPAHPST
jgi:hypothetical protein